MPIRSDFEESQHVVVAYVMDFFADRRVSVSKVPFWWGFSSSRNSKTATKHRRRLNDVGCGANRDVGEQEREDKPRVLSARFHNSIQTNRGVFIDGKGLLSTSNVNNPSIFKS
jgi:hypothetical protein